ncbi:MAG: choice-of-anchor tandem repeat GloVer-containing protein [Rhodospirillales bacterium]
MSYGSLLRAASGNLYGTTSRGGASGYGTVFEVTP